MQLTGARSAAWMEFDRRREGMQYALQGGLWLHRFRLRDEPMAHLVSSDCTLLQLAGERLGMRSEWLQFKPLKLPSTGRRIPAWHWDLRGGYLERAVTLAFPRR